VTGRRDQEEISEMLRDVDLCVDATHPYAVEVTENIRAACEKTGVLRKRLLRPAEMPEEMPAGNGRMKIVADVQAAVAFLAEQPGRVLLTTGAKDLPIYGVLGGERLFPRVLPTASSLEACENAGIPRRNIIAMHGPFTDRLNQALMDQFDIDLMVTKDSGKAGGFMDKVNAAAAEGVFTVVIARPEESGDTLEEIAAWCRSDRHE
jgi:precorrin-6x reductase